MKPFCYYDGALQPSHQTGFKPVIVIGLGTVCAHTREVLAICVIAVTAIVEGD